MPTARSLPILLVPLLLMGCGLKRHYDVGERVEARQVQERPSPTPHADAVFAERYREGALDEAVSLYWDALEKKQQQPGMRDLDAKRLTVALYMILPDEDDYHLLSRLAKGLYWQGVMTSRAGGDAADLHLKGRTCAFAAMRVVPEFRTLFDVGAKMRDISSLVPVERIDALRWISSNWGRWAETRGALSQLKDLPDGHAMWGRGIELDPHHDWAYAHRGLAITYALVPPFLGGDLELAEQHFLRSMELYPEYKETHVAYAEYVLIPKGDRETFDRLLEDVLAAPEEPSEYLLDNLLAKEKARKLMKEADQRF